MENKSIFFEITDICNHKCVHCCKSWRTDCNHIMSKEDLDIIINYPKTHLTISGGEPSLARDSVFYIVEHETVGITLNTNLTLWSESDIQRLINKNVTFSVSVVSLNREAYKKITGVDTYDLLINNLKLIPKNSKILFIINDISAATAKDTVNWLIAHGFTNLIVSPAIPNKWTTINQKKILNIIKDISKHHRNVRIETMNNLDHELVYNHDCDAGCGRLVILSNGDVVPCACFDKHILGNIRNNSFWEISKRGDLFYKSYPENKQKICKGILENV